ncbi:phosphatidylinositol transfer protein 3-like [Populus alba x Populus x berolinensis]|nr:phosphatidylinositol transfer protein 3-like [Populus alba x Populus x berolinensis]
MENATTTLNPDQDQMVWLIDFQGWTMSCISVKAARETAHILQNHYPERLGVGILYNPPKVFESFWTLVKPFIEPKTSKKVRFVYSNGPQSQKLMEELFDMDKLDCAFGGRNSAGFNHETYAQWMREDDKKKFDMMNCGSSSPLPSTMSESQSSETLTPSGISVASDEDDSSSGDEKTLNLENIDEKTQGLPLSCEDVAVSEAEDVAVSEAVDVGKELKKGELA